MKFCIFVLSRICQGLFIKHKVTGILELLGTSFTVCSHDKFNQGTTVVGERIGNKHGAWTIRLKNCECFAAFLK